MSKPCEYCGGEGECIHKRLDAFIEYAEATRKFHDADFYKHCKKHILNLEQGVDNVKIEKKDESRKIYITG